MNSKHEICSPLIWCPGCMLGILPYIYWACCFPPRCVLLMSSCWRQSSPRLQQDYESPHISPPCTWVLPEQGFFRLHREPHVFAPVLGEVHPVQAVHAPAAPIPCAPQSLTPSPSNRHSSAAPIASPSLCWYHQSHGELAQKCRTPCSWSEN